MSTLLSFTRDQLITLAIKRLGVLAQGQSPSTEDLADGAAFLSTLVAELRTKGMPLWKRTTYSFTPTSQVTTIGVGKTLDTPFPLKLLQAYTLTNTGQNKIQMEILSDYDFNYLPISTTPGMPLKISYQPQNEYGTIKLWPLPDGASTVSIVYQAPFDYFDSSVDTMDFPEEWYNALIMKLSVLLAPQYGIPLPIRQDLKQDAKEALEDALSFGGEDGSFYFSVDRRR